jgi:hypothetical protein
MAFVQIASYTTTQPEELAAARRRWLEATDGVAAAHRRLVLKDRDVEGRYVEFVIYASYEDAMHNAMLPATAALLGHAVHDVGHGVHVAHLDVIEGEL